MTSLRSHLERLKEADDLVSVTDRVHWDGTAAAVAREAIRNSCPAVRFDTTPGDVRFASGVYTGPDQLTERTQSSWRRIGQALGLGADCQYTEILERLSRSETRAVDPRTLESPEANETDGDLYSLGLPSNTRGGRPIVTLGVLAVERNEASTWVPIRGEVRHGTGLRLSVPRAFADWCGEDADVSVLLGVSAGALLASLQGWTCDGTDPDVPGRAAALADVSMATVGSRIVPSAAEVRLDGRMRLAADDLGGPEAAWERACDVTTVDVTVEEVALRDDPVVPFAPLGVSLTDDVLMTSLVEAAQLYRRVNNYWGVSPVRWIRLPFEARLGLCIVSSEILYAGFEWQLANTLFSFSRLFDKVLVVDEQSDPTDLARALDDMWVKAHPANDWIFSEPNAPSAAAPTYRRDGRTGSRLYINATWDPRWDEEYIAPRVTFETSYPENVRIAARERWDELGLEEDER